MNDLNANHIDDTRKRLASINNNNNIISNKTNNNITSNSNNNNNSNIPAYLKQITQDRLLKSTFQAVEMPEWKRQLIEKKKRQQAN